MFQIDLQQFERDGFSIVADVFDALTLRYLTFALDLAATEGAKRKGGTRDVVDHSLPLQELAEQTEILQIVSQVLGVEAFLVRATLFDKTPEANWKVPWHQDVTIAVKERRDTPGYGPWSVKSGIPHVQPPSHVLERMLTIRVHIDPCPTKNGALRVMPGSHRLGRLNQNEVPAYIDEQLVACCAANAGDLLVMRPLLLHSSSASLEPGHRRVLHFDFSAGDLATGLQWRMRDNDRPTLSHKPVGR
jgi:ectoine hydroxylase-related dioxygenase (phytanoyl-CoA dioxygenase family)